MPKPIQIRELWVTQFGERQRLHKCNAHEGIVEPNGQGFVGDPLVHVDQINVRGQTVALRDRDQRTRVSLISDGAMNAPRAIVIGDYSAEQDAAPAEMTSLSIRGCVNCRGGNFDFLGPNHLRSISPAVRTKKVMTQV